MEVRAMPYWVYGQDKKTGQPCDPIVVETDDEAMARREAARLGMEVEETEQVAHQEINDAELKTYPCPECAKEMERGYVLAHHSIRWARDEKKGSIFVIAAETLTPGSFFRLRNPRCAGLRCRQCGLVLFKEWSSQ